MVKNNIWCIDADQHDQPRSYTIQTPYGNTYHRNAKHLIRTNENFENISLDDEMTFEHGDTNINQENQSNNFKKLYTTRSGRTVKTTDQIQRLCKIDQLWSE